MLANLPAPCARNYPCDIFASDDQYESHNDIHCGLCRSYDFVMMTLGVQMRKDETRNSWDGVYEQNQSEYGHNHGRQLLVL